MSDPARTMLRHTLATLAYRLVSYWMPLAIGPFAYLLHQRRYRDRPHVPDAGAAPG